MAEATTCIVCGEPADETNASDCSSCGERFHLNQRNDREGKDCGTVWINDQYLALEFACQRCLEGAGASQPQPQPHPQQSQSRPRRRRYRKRA